ATTSSSGFSRLRSGMSGHDQRARDDEPGHSEDSSKLGLSPPSVGQSAVSPTASRAAIGSASRTKAARRGVSRSSCRFQRALTAELWYQTVGFRWAHNSSDHQAEEIDRFVGY
ncbi:MAG: hypothetical protein WBP36_09880, partial [Thermoanaerobaculia bacterium]